MAINIPTYRERTVKEAPISGQKQQISAPAAAFGAPQAEAMMNAGTAIKRLGDQWNTKAINIQSENNELRALKLQTDMDAEMSEFLYNPQGGMLTKKGENALQAPQMTQQKISEIQARLDDSQEAPEVRKMLQKSLIQTQRRYGDLAKRHQLQEYTAYKDNTLNARFELNMEEIGLNYMDDTAFNEKMEENYELLKSRAVSEGWADDQLGLARLKAYSQARTSQITNILNQGDPQNVMIAEAVYKESLARGQLRSEDSSRMELQFKEAIPKAVAATTYDKARVMTSVTDQGDVVNFVIDNLEGGDAIAQEPDGAIAKYGINSKWNPDVDVENLTREGAAAVYKEKYWNAYGIEEVPENMRLLAFDIAVNHRSDFAKKIIEKIKDGADPDKVMNARLMEYHRLKSADPEKYGKYWDGWVDRLAKVSTQMNTDVEPNYSTITQAANQIETLHTGAGKELMAIYESDKNARAAAKAADKNEVQDLISEMQTQNNGDWRLIPSNIRARARSHNIDFTAYKGISDPNTVYTIDAMSSDQLLAADLNDPVFVQNLSFTDRQNYIKKQAELQKPENKYMAGMVDGAVDYYFRAQGKGTKFDPDDKKNKAAVAEMRNYVTFRAQVDHSSNKEISKQNVMKYASDYLILQKKSRTNDMHSIDTATRQQIEDQLIALNVTPTPEAVWATYEIIRNDIDEATKP